MFEAIVLIAHLVGIVVYSVGALVVAATPTLFVVFL